MTKPRLTKSDQVLLFKRLSLYLNAGMPLLQGLTSLRTSVKKPSTRKILTACEEVIQRGHPLSEALGAYPYLFDSFTIGLVHAGEMSGNLSKTLGRIAQVIEQRQSLEQRLIGVCIYPAIVLLSTLGISVFLTVYVFPKMLPILEGFHSTLPWPTRFLLGTNNLLTHYGIALMFVGIGMSALLAVSLRKKSIRIRVERALLFIPFVRIVFKTYYLARLFLVLSMVYESGVSIIPSLSISESALNSLLYRDGIKSIQTHIEQGEHIGAAFTQFPHLFPDVVYQLLSAGEDTGTLRQNFSSLAEIFMSDLETLTRTMTVLIEPVLMVCMGTIVGTIALAIIMPIYQITGNLSA